MERGTAVQPCEGVAVAGLPQAQGPRAGGHPCLPVLHGDAGGGSRSRAGSRAWIDAEYQALHCLKLILVASLRSGCVEVALCGWVGVALMGWIMEDGGFGWLCLVLDLSGT